MRTSLTLLLVVGALGGAAHADEFLGPFPSWLNVKADYGAVGDGKADDTAAIQRALEDIRKPDFPRRVLYFPAGAYRLTQTVKLLRAAHSQSQGVCLYGEDPQTTALVWDGPEGGVMLHYNGWYSEVARVAFDGRGKAKTALEHGVAFTTCNQLTDLLIKDVQFGIEAGIRDGIAETAVLRCRFHRCSKAAISIQNFNSLDWYIWHCLFEDCALGVTNEFGAGNFHVYESLFKRSTEADVSIRHCGYFSLYGNTSVGSKAFFLSKRARNWTRTETWGANVTLQRNTILDPLDVTPIRIENNGPTMLLDNTVRGRGATERGPVVRSIAPSEQSDLISLGNTFTTRRALEVKGRLLALGDRVVGDIVTAAPGPCPFLARATRPVIEVQRGADAAAIQAAVDQAAKLRGRRPVVHLPAGNYPLRQTVVLPAGTDLQLVGDGLLQATQLNWAGEGEGPILRIMGPTHATVREIGLSGGKGARCIVAQGLDQPGARVFMEQGQTSGYEYGLVVEGLDHTYVALHDHGHNGIQVVGGAAAAAGRRPEGITALFCGASSRDRNSQDEGIDLYSVSRGARLLVRDIWYEGPIWHFLNLTDRGEFAYHSGNIAPYAGPTGDSAVIAVDGFRGKVLLSQIEPMNGPLRVSGGSAETAVLGLGLITRDAPLSLAKASPEAGVAFLSCRTFRKEPTGTDSLPDVGTASPAFLREMLQPLRTTLPRAVDDLPARVTDLRVYRVFTYGKVGVELR